PKHIATRVKGKTRLSRLNNDMFTPPASNLKSQVLLLVSEITPGDTVMPAEIPLKSARDILRAIIRKSKKMLKGQKDCECKFIYRLFRLRMQYFLAGQISKSS
ncbi:MAG: hypothetical protein AAF438_15465, partial [Pseudomonadota bacterium]